MGASRIRNHDLPFIKEQLEADYSLGLSMEHIGKRYGFSETAILAAFRMFGIKSRRPGWRGIRGPQHYGWIGDAAGYKTLHERLRKVRGTPQKCEDCGTTDPTKRYEWASLNGNYGDFDDYKRLCKACHNIFDGIAYYVSGPRKRTVYEKIQRNNVSGYRGVSPKGIKWIAVCAKIHLGYFEDPIEAAKAYDYAALVLYGELALTNFDYVEVA